MSKYENLSISELEGWIQNKLSELGKREYEMIDERADYENEEHKDSLVKILAVIENWIIDLQHLLGENYIPRGGT